MQKMNGSSVNMTAQNIEQLKALFPEIVIDGGKIDFEQLKAVLGEAVETAEERYQFTWHGKKRTMEHAQAPSKGTLRPAVEKSEQFETTQNVYIEGDNLEVLKLLQKSYTNKVQVIYIDPPYNTGKDFVYKDNFTQSVASYLQQTNQVDADGQALVANTESNGRFHTDWLNMMYARLKVARNLLTEDGVMFISIDDHEQERLKLMCNEIFGEHNFLAQLIWERAYSPVNLKKNFSESHDFVLVYGKNTKDLVSNGLKRGDEANSRYMNPDNDARGLWKPSDLSVGPANPKNIYEITTPSGRKVLPPNGYSWRLSADKFAEYVADNRIWFGESGNNVPAIKRFLSEVKDSITPMTIWKYSDVGHSQSASQALKKLFDNKAYFSYPKPVELIKRMIALYSEPDSIILDFFSGSATTAHATMELNAEDGGTRKFVMVQLPEPLAEKDVAYQDGYRTICDIGQERIRRAAAIIRETYDVPTLDTGFKVFTLDQSNIREWHTDFAHVEETLALHATPFIEGRSELDIVFEVLLKQGFELTASISTFEAAGQTVYNVEQGALFICLGQDITPAVAQAIAANEGLKSVSIVILSDAGFASDAHKLNCLEILKAAGYPEHNVQTI